MRPDDGEEQRGGEPPATRTEACASAGRMLVFMDFEASSLDRKSYPIEVAWVFEDGRAETHLIRPEPGWRDWSPAAEALHGISRAQLEADGEPAASVAARLVEALGGHDLLASAPSWDGKWLSVLLRAGGFPRHRLRLRDSERARREAVEAVIGSAVPETTRAQVAEELLTLEELREGAPAHRALPDAIAERQAWLLVRSRAQQWLAEHQPV